MSSDRANTCAALMRSDAGANRASSKKRPRVCVSTGTSGAVAQDASRNANSRAMQRAMVPLPLHHSMPGPPWLQYRSPVFAFFESRIRPTALPEAPPPGGLIAFYWHFIRQTRGLYAAMFFTGLCVALIDTAIPVFIGKLVTLMSAADRAQAFHDALPMLIGVAVVILVGRPIAVLADSL